jgi:hypothetical protein
MSEPQHDLDPGQVVAASEVEITDPEHPDFVEPGVEYGGEG